MSNSPEIIGSDVLRLGGAERISGAARFAADIPAGDALALSVLRSEKPHARIVKIDTKRALRVPGCVAVFTSADIPGGNRFGIINKDQPLLADDKVRFVGDSVALVAAESIETAEMARKEIQVIYEDLPAVFDPEEALRPGAPLVHGESNVLGKRIIKRGNPEGAFRQADIIIDRSYTTSFVEHTYLEPDAGLAYWDADGLLTIYASTQKPSLRSKGCRSSPGDRRKPRTDYSGRYRWRVRLQARLKRPGICGPGGLPPQTTGQNGLQP